MDIIWDGIKHRIYLVGDSLRNIYINNTTEKHWGKWINYVNENYKINWNNKNKIDFEIIKKQLERKHSTRKRKYL
jgi:hypothetical protein